MGQAALASISPSVVCIKPGQRCSLALGKDKGLPGGGGGAHLRPLSLTEPTQGEWLEGSTGVDSHLPLGPTASRNGPCHWPGGLGGLARGAMLSLQLPVD